MKRDLTLHPDCTSAATRIVVAVRRDCLALSLRYTVWGDVAALLVPAHRQSRRSDELWQHTCFEAFVRDSTVRDLTGAAYLEMNFSPSSEWAAYRFDAYRAGMRAADDVHARIVTQVAEQLSVEANVTLPAPLDGELQLGLSAVIEERTGRKSYWALAHPPGKPDFHHASSFCLTLPSLIPSA